jgi:hypothetical protein
VFCQSKRGVGCGFWNDMELEEKPQVIEFKPCFVCSLV